MVVILTLRLRHLCVCVSGKYCQSGLKVQYCDSMGDKTLSAATFLSQSPSVVCLHAHMHTKARILFRHPNNLTQTDIHTEMQTHLNSIKNQQHDRVKGVQKLARHPQ